MTMAGALPSIIFNFSNFQRQRNSGLFSVSIFTDSNAYTLSIVMNYITYYLRQGDRVFIGVVCVCVA